MLSGYPPSLILRKFTREGAAVWGKNSRRDLTFPTGGGESVGGRSVIVLEEARTPRRGILSMEECRGEFIKGKTRSDDRILGDAQKGTHR